MKAFIRTSFIWLLVFSLVGCKGSDDHAKDYNRQKENLTYSQAGKGVNLGDSHPLRVTQSNESVPQVRNREEDKWNKQGLSNDYHGHLSDRPPHSQPKKPTSNPQYIKVQLLGINDLHGQLNVTRKVNGKPAGRVDYLASYLKERALENKNTVLVQAGDMIGASPPISALLQDEPTMDFLNYMNFNIGTVGNHEFDEGVSELLRLIHGGTHEKTGDFGGSTFPWLAANVIDEKTGKPILPPYQVLKVNGMKIAFIGVCTTDTPTIVIPSGVKGIKFIDEAEAINRSVAELKQAGVRSIVVLAHNPGASSFNGEQAIGEVVEMAKKVDDEVDIIYGGHNHAYLNTTVDGKLLVQSYSYGTAFSDVDLEIDPKTKNIMNKSAEIVTVFQDGIEPNAEITKMIKQYEAKIEPLVNRLIGTVNAPITALQNEDGESALGNLIADSQRTAMQTDFAFMNPGGIRADIDKGDVTWGELFTVQPFNNNLVKLNLNGRQIREVLNQQWQGEKRTMLQISGLTYSWDDNQPIGQKIINVQLPDGTALDVNKSYTVTVNNFLANGGDGFTLFREGSHREMGPVDLDALVEFIRSQPQPFTANIEGRIHKMQY